MSETGAAPLLREVLDALTAHDLERIEFEDVGGARRPTAGTSGGRSAAAS